MQLEDAVKLQKEWENKECSHPSIEKFYYLGTQDDYVCSICGQYITREERELILSNR